MAVTRILKTTKATLTHTFVVDGVPTNAAGDVTVTVTRLDGIVVVSGTATLVDDPGGYSFALPTAAELDVWLVAWTGQFAGADVTVIDAVEIVGGFFFGIDEVRKRLSLGAEHPDTELAERRIEVEQEAEDIIGRAMVPRFARIALTGNDTNMVLTPHLGISRIRAVVVDGTALDASALANVRGTAAGVLWRRGGYWPSWAGPDGIIVELEHGERWPGEPVRSAAVQRMRSVLSVNNSGIPDRALSYSISPEGGVYRLSLPTAETTGIPAIDAIYQRAQLPVGGFA